MVQSFQSSQGSAPAQASNDARASPGEPTGRSKISWLGESWRRELRELDSSPVGNHFLSVSAHPSSSSQHLSTFRTTSSGISLLRLTHLLQILVVIFLLLYLYSYSYLESIYSNHYIIYIYIYKYYTYIIHILYIYYTYIIHILYIYHTVYA